VNYWTWRLSHKFSFKALGALGVTRLFWDELTGYARFDASKRYGGRNALLVQP